MAPIISVAIIPINLNIKLEYKDKIFFRYSLISF
nr:MAG TPA: hypothetical protein [Bacteriophage sp.]